MKFIASISLIAVFIFGIIKMREASSEIKSIWFRELSNSNKLKVTSKVKEIFRELSKKPRFVFNKLFSIKKHNKQEVVTAFSGLLELSRRSKVETTQEEIFGDITVEKAKRA